MDVLAVSDKLEIQEQLARYARGVDRRDWDLWKSVFTDDAWIDYSSAGAAVGTRDEVAEWFAANFTLPWAQHVISNVEIELAGDRARVIATFFNPMQITGMDTPSACGGYYHHDFVRTPQGWKSERLVEENVWFANPPRARAT